MKEENKKPDRHTMRLIAFGVILYAALMNLNRVASGLSWLLGVFSSIFIGLIIALILDVPMHGFQVLFAKLDKKNRLPENSAPGCAPPGAEGRDEGPLLHRIRNFTNTLH